MVLDIEAETVCTVDDTPSKRPRLAFVRTGKRGVGDDSVSFLVSTALGGWANTVFWRYEVGGPV